MEYILFISMIIIFAFGFVIMDRLDRFIASPNYMPDLKVQNTEKCKSKDVLIFGTSVLSQDIANLLKNNNISYTLIQAANELNKADIYKYLFAVDENDLENIMMCIIGEKMMGISQKIAICNCLDNRKVFEQNNIPYLFGSEITALTLYNKLISPSSNKEVG